MEQTHMTYHDQWRAISSRIRGLTQSADLYARFLSINSGDAHGSGKLLRTQVEGLQSSLGDFRNKFEKMLPPVAVASIDTFLQDSSKLTGDKSGGPGSKQQRVWAALVMLNAFESELSFILSNTQQEIRARSERAFAHLQRMIAVDQEFRRTWQQAYEKGETHCEKLGAVHLLLHGIFAFKVDAAGARTDLVYQDRSGALSEDARYVDGLVLTEWKKAASVRSAEKQFEVARAQAKRYAQGVLAGNELASFRFAVVVSKHQVEPPPDVTEEGIVYRHVNIAIDPQVPSRA